MGGCQATMTAEVEVNKPVKATEPAKAKEAPAENEPARDKRPRKPAVGREEARGIDFDLWFPVLTSTLAALAALTNFEAIRRSLKYANEDFYNWTTREFLA